MTENITARFISQDTYTGNAYDPWTQHLYSYCGNNPTNFIDPTGHEMACLNELIKTRDFRKMLRDGYLSSWEDCSKAAMFDDYRSMLQHGYLENNKSVTQLNTDIGVLDREIEFAKDHYDSQDEAAIGWGNEAMPASVADDLEYGGAIYNITITFSNEIFTAFCYTDPFVNKGKQHSCKPWISNTDVKYGAEVVAYIHTLS